LAVLVLYPCRCRNNDGERIYLQWDDVVLTMLRGRLYVHNFWTQNDGGMFLLLAKDGV
jgi:hypothetical protein